MGRRILALAAGLLVVAALTGWGRTQHGSHGAQQPDAARAVAALGRGTAVHATPLPADFAAVMGAHATGCSSPFGATWWDFTTACRDHDLGYDLLRYADRKGQPLGRWARHAVDHRFALQTRARCHDLACRLAAGTYATVVTVNSWRQGYGVPVVESAGRWAAAGLAGIGTALLVATVPMPTRPRRWSTVGSTVRSADRSTARPAAARAEL